MVCCDRGRFIERDAVWIQEETVVTSPSDRNLVCRDCGITFVFTSGEQEFYAAKGFRNDPARCPECREVRRRERRGPRELHTVVCERCGVTTEVPFQPTGAKPVYCRDCFEALGLK